VKITIKNLLHYFWDSPGLGFRIKIKNSSYVKVYKIPYWLAMLICKTSDLFRLHKGVVK